MRFFEISEAGLRIQNPFSLDRVMLVGELCRECGFLMPEDRLLDLACGQGEMLCQWAKELGILGRGVDISQDFIDAARRRAEELSVAASVEFVQGDAADYPQNAGAGQYDAVSCIGATWIGGGTAGTIDLMRQGLASQDRGLLLLGDMFWEGQPSDEAAAAMGVETQDVSTLSGMYDLFDRAGLQMLNMVLTDDEGWDRYQTYHWMSIYRWLQEQRDDPDADAFRAEIEDWKRSYLCYRGRFGWGVFLLTGK